MRGRGRWIAGTPFNKSVTSRLVKRAEEQLLKITHHACSHFLSTCLCSEIRTALQQHQRHEPTGEACRGAAPEGHPACNHRRLWQACAAAALAAPAAAVPPHQCAPKQGVCGRGVKLQLGVLESYKGCRGTCSPSSSTGPPHQCAPKKGVQDHWSSLESFHDSASLVLMKEQSLESSHDSASLELMTVQSLESSHDSASLELMTVQSLWVSLKPGDGGRPDQ
eukprot:scaffold83773_cov17-Tisochrysis_lutea.AAC.2